MAARLCSQMCVGQTQRGDPGFPISLLLPELPAELKKTLKLDRGFPFEVSQVRNQLLSRLSHGDDSQYKFTSEERQVDVFLNQKFWKGTRFDSSSSQSHPIPIPVSVWRCSVAPIMHWKRMCTSLARSNPHTALESIVSDIISKASSNRAGTKVGAETKSRLDEDCQVVARHFTDMNNPAHVQATVAYLVGSLSSSDIVPGFPLFVSCARGQKTERPNNDPFVEPTWEQITMTESARSYGDDFLSMDRMVHSDQLFAHLFQVIVALDAAQRMFGYCHQGLDLSHLGFVNAPTPDTVLYVKWRGKMYRVPTFGRIVKILPSRKETIQVPSSRCAAFDKAVRAECKRFNDNSNYDLAILSKSILAAIKGRPVSVQCPQKGNPLVKMLLKWNNCIREPQTRISGGTDELPDSKHSILGLAKVVSPSECCDATPSEQARSGWFSDFEISKEQVPEGALIYTV